jgi:TetR/AcrR family transcriptional regulator, transcriptional repressor for nem operon
MARPREFDIEKALDSGMHVLWSRGYEATSLEDLLAAMHLSKSSFYDTFRSKREFLLAALGRYTDSVLGQLARDLQNGSARTAIAHSFQFALPPEGKPSRGCFLQNCILELAHRDPMARVAAASGLERLEEGYYHAVRRGQQSGEINGKHNARVLARYLVSNLNGLQVLAKAGMEPDALTRIVQITMRALG